ncbi:type I restriction enzyme M protein [Massilia sp. UYP11]|uniref:HsdM family class I SAM-dependent methyltransferase n=1 Tax=Massilia sp. UYP11 TaxID=1756385 RepID=UPI003D238ECB
MAQKIGAALLAHAETIWRTADTLRAAGVKESEFPSYMMPFFALMLLESRLRRFKAEKVAEFEKAMKVKFDPANKDHRDWLEAAAKAVNKGYHPELLLLDKGLRETCAVPGGNFRARLMAHLDQYDPETKKLLGLGYAESDPKYLDIQGKAADLFARPNSLLFAFAQKWAAIDLTPFSNSEVTTMEEHIKRKWGDISAETAGEQYTPSDVIDLCNTLVVEMRKRGGHAPDGIAKCYDMTCGGGNFLFGGEDALRQEFPELSVQTFGQELNDALYALAAIEARFREDATIAHGNTLTHDHFLSERFDVIQANPPYGSDWKDFKATVEADATGRFAKKRLPPVSDGQLLFLQHAAFHLAERGVATIVHNGSTLFSGDAGGGESETRRWLMKELDIVESIIQLPKNEFFNTEISTYVWVLNKHKPAARKGRVLLINAERCCVKLKRNLNKKNCEVDATNRARIVEALRNFEDGPISKVLTVDQLLYNKVELLVHRHDEDGRAVQDLLDLGRDSMAIHIDEVEFQVAEGELRAPTGAPELSPKELAANFNERVKNASRIGVSTTEGSWVWDVSTGEVVATKAGKSIELGLGKLAVKAKVGKVKKVDRCRVNASLEPLMQRDVEHVEYRTDEAENQKVVQDYLTRWMREPGTITKVTLGSEINFNKAFPRLSGARSTKDVLAEISGLNRKMVELERQFEAALGAGE